MDRQEEFVLRTIEERDIRFVRLWFTDVLGTLKSVAVAPAELEGAFAEGIGFDGSAIEGLSRVYEADIADADDLIVSFDRSRYFDTTSTVTMWLEKALPDTEAGQEEMYQHVRFRVESHGVTSPWTAWEDSSQQQFSN